MIGIDYRRTNLYKIQFTWNIQSCTRKPWINRQCDKGHQRFQPYFSRSITSSQNGVSDRVERPIKQTICIGDQF